MKKLQLDNLKVDSFATSAPIEAVRGTVAAHQSAQCTVPNCPDSWDGTCYLSCGYSCYCDTAPLVCN